MIKLSIITINYNNASGLQKTIQSVVQQDCSGIEYIVIDGNSSDDSIEIIKKYEDQITYWVSEPNKGIYGNMNRGIKEVNGAYCLFLNSGDWLVEDSLNKIIPWCEHADIIYCNTYLSYNNTRFETIRYPTELTMRHFYKQTIGHQSTLIRSDLFKQYGLYNENNRVHSDYEFWIKSIIAGNCTCKHVDEFLTYYDMGGISSKPTRSSQSEIDRILEPVIPPRVLADYENWYVRTTELQVWEWVKSKRVLYAVIRLLFKSAVALVTLKRQLILTKSAKQRV